MPPDVGVPLIVIVSADQAAVTPGGNPDVKPIPATPEVVCALKKNCVLIQTVGADERTSTAAGSKAVTVIVPVALTLPQPPFNGIM